MKTASIDAGIAAIERRKGRTPTSHQTAIYSWLATGSGHAVVNAVAGSGKTTTLMDGLEFIPSSADVLMVAFNKHIAEELTSRGLPENCMAQTLHSAGYGALRYGEKKRYMKVDANKVRRITMNLMGFDQMNTDEKKEFWQLCYPLCRVVSLLKNFGFGFLHDYPSNEEIVELASKYDVDIPGESLLETFFHQLENVYKQSLKEIGSIDYDDMLAIPVARNHTFKQYDYVFVDESQDLNPIQIEIVKRLLRPNGRAIFVGDRHQAIYGFRGADPEAIQTILDDFSAVEMPLSISWRCPHTVISAAQEIVPHIEASPRALDGSVSTVSRDIFDANVTCGDYVLCRVTADLVAGCLKCIREGRKAVVMGRDIGKGLLSLLKRVREHGGSGDIWERIEAFGEFESEKFKKPRHESQLASFQDRIDTLKVLAEGLDNFSAIEDRIEKIFSDNKSGIVFSTIHKAKGLEADRVYVLRPDLLPHPMARQDWQREQEENLKYVAITRAMKELIWVQKG